MSNLNVQRLTNFLYHPAVQPFRYFRNNETLGDEKIIVNIP